MKIHHCQILENAACPLGRQRTGDGPFQEAIVRFLLEEPDTGSKIKVYLRNNSLTNVWDDFLGRVFVNSAAQVSQDLALTIAESIEIDAFRKAFAAMDAGRQRQVSNKLSALSSREAKRLLGGYAPSQVKQLS